MRYQWLPDKIYIFLKFFYHFWKFPNLSNPRTFNEKIQWLKLYDRRPEYTVMVDKYAAKQWIGERIGEEYVIPTLGVWERTEDIDFDALPDRFVLKTNHNSGGVLICKDKSALDRSQVIQVMNVYLAKNGFFYGREWPYKNVFPRIIAETYLEDEPGKTLVDYKVFCFNGEPKIVMVGKGDPHGAGRTRDFYDLELNLLPLTNGTTNSEELITQLPQLKEILSIAEKLSAGIPHLRVDTYIVNGRVYVGELTFYHNSGFVPFKPESWDRKLGEWIQLPEKTAG